MLKVRKFAMLFFLTTVSLVLIYGNAISSTGAVNINTASIEELMQLNKIGEKYAKRIIEYREKNGPFEKPEDIVLVKGIGQKTYDINKDNIVVSNTPSE